MNRQIFKDTFFVSIAGLFAQGLGFLLSMLIAGKFGVSSTTDAYYLAYTIPVILIGMIGGVLKVAFVPVFVEERIRNPREVQNIVSASVCLILIISFLGIFILGGLSRFGVLSLGRNLGVASLTSELILEMLPLVPLALLFYLLNAIYNSYQKFAIAEFATAVQWVIAIIFVLFFSDRFGIHSIVYGQLMGQFISLLILIRAINSQIELSIRPKWIIPAGLRRVLKISFFPFASYLLWQLNPFVARLVSSYLGEGSISILSYADKLAKIPQLLVGSGFTAVLISYWSKLSAEGDKEGLEESVNQGISALITLLIPLAAGFVILKDPLVKLAFQRGSFDQTSAMATARVFALLAVQIIPTYLFTAILRILFTEKAVGEVFSISLSGFVIGAALMPIFALNMELGVWGIALVMLFRDFALFAITAIVVHKRHVSMNLRLLANTTGRVGLSSLLMIGVVIALQGLLQDPGEPTAPVILVACAVTGSTFYFLALYLLRQPEALSLFKIALSQVGIIKIPKV